MKKSSTVSPFFIEMILVILFFSISSVAILRLFAATHATASNSQNLTKAIFLAENQAETLKSSKCEKDIHAIFPNASVKHQSDDTLLTQYYDHNGQACKEDTAFFCMKTFLHSKDEPNGQMLYANINIYLKSSKNPFYTLSTGSYFSNLNSEEGGS